MRSTRWAVAVAALAAPVLLTTACTHDGIGSSPPRRPPSTTAPVAISTRTATLVRADSCEDLAQHIEREADAAGPRFGTSSDGSGEASADSSGSAAAGPPTTVAPMAPEALSRSAAPSAAAADAAGGQAGSVVAGTNVQEQGVDEGDLVKTDGHLLVSAIDGVIRVAVLDDHPTVDGTLRLDGAASTMDAIQPVQLHLRGEEALVVATRSPIRFGPASTEGAPADDVMRTVDEPATLLARVDLSDPAHPRTVEQTTVDGRVVATRLHDGRVRVVLQSGVPYAMPAGDTAATSTERLLPRRLAEDGSSQPIGGCGDVLVSSASSQTVDGSGTTGSDAGASASTSFAPQGRVTVLTVDRDLAHLAPVSVDAQAQTVYASTDALYLAAQVWGPGGSTTVVHRLALGGEGPARYTGSGFAPGTLLDQYSLSERGGALRLVTTTDAGGVLPEEGDVAVRGTVSEGDGPATTIAPTPAGPASSAPRRWGPAGRLTVLRPDANGTLVEVGHVDDLGVGEQVRSVRFLDDLAYVVTFRRTDPLFAIDLSDPTAPRVLGELHLPGFSEYLHPVAPGRLLGIGSDATTSGAVRGFKATLFDVTDPTRPRELDSFTLPDGQSAVGQDPHAFTWDARDGLAVVPIQRTGTWCEPDAGCSSSSPTTGGIASLVVSVGGDHLRVRGTLVHTKDGWPVAIQRAVVVDDSIWTVSSGGLGRTSVADPTSVALQPW